MTIVRRTREPLHRDLLAKAEDFDTWLKDTSIRRIFRHPEVKGGKPITVVTSGAAYYFDDRSRVRILLPPRLFSRKGGTLLEKVTLHEAAWAYHLALNDPNYIGELGVKVSRNPLDWHHDLVTIDGVYRVLVKGVKHRYRNGKCGLCRGPARSCMKRHAEGKSCA